MTTYAHTWRIFNRNPKVRSKKIGKIESLDKIKENSQKKPTFLLPKLFSSKEEKPEPNL